MKFTEHIVTKLLNTTYEDFTSYCITALSIAESDNHFNKKDIARIEWLIDNVHEDIKTSIYKLDRFVDPTRVDDNPTKYSYPIKFKSDVLMDETGDSKKQISIKSEDLMRYLCKAVQEINKLMYKNMSAYNEDFVMPTSVSSNDSEGFD